MWWNINEHTHVTIFCVYNVCLNIWNSHHHKIEYKIGLKRENWTVANILLMIFNINKRMSTFEQWPNAYSVSISNVFEAVSWILLTVDRLIFYGLSLKKKSIDMLASDFTIVCVYVIASLWWYAPMESASIFFPMLIHLNKNATIADP